MCEAYSKNGKDETHTKHLSENLKGRSHLEDVDLPSGKEDNIRMDLREVVRDDAYWIYWNRGNGTWDPTTGEKVLDYVRDYQLLKKKNAHLS
jgi:hypothetical protein